MVALNAGCSHHFLAERDLFLHPFRHVLGELDAGQVLIIQREVQGLVLLRDLRHALAERHDRGDIGVGLVSLRLVNDVQLAVDANENLGVESLQFLWREVASAPALEHLAEHSLLIEGLGQRHAAATRLVLALTEISAFMGQLEQKHNLALGCELRIFGWLRADVDYAIANALMDACWDGSEIFAAFAIDVDGHCLCLVLVFLLLPNGRGNYLEEVDLKRKLQRSESPHACIQVMVLSPKITGMSQFHSHMTGRERISEKPNATMIKPTKIPIAAKITVVMLFIFFLRRNFRMPLGVVLNQIIPFLRAKGAERADLQHTLRRLAAEQAATAFDGAHGHSAEPAIAGLHGSPDNILTVLMLITDSMVVDRAGNLPAGTAQGERLLDVGRAIAAWLLDAGRRNMNRSADCLHHLAIRQIQDFFNCYHGLVSPEMNQSKANWSTLISCASSSESGAPLEP